MIILTQPGPYTSSTLPNGRVAYWKLDEASGVALDSGPNGLTLTDTNTVGAAAGQINGARLFVAAQSESLSRADTAVLRGGDHDWAWAMWVNLATKGTVRSFVTKRSGASYEYQVYYSSTLDRFAVYCNGVDLRPAGFAAVVAGAWYHLYAQYDAAANLLGLSVNGAALATAALASGGSATAGALSVGIDGAAYPMDGRIDNVQFWNARVLTPAEVAEDYANGLAGRES
jgi:hypothetical protein